MNILAVNYFEKKCRICGSEIFDASSFNIDIYLEEKIRKYLHINISQTDKLPKIICGNCFIKLDGFHRFARLALKTEENYLTYLSRMKFIEERSQENVLPNKALINVIEDLKPKITPALNRKLSIRPSRIQKTRSSRPTLEQIVDEKIVKDFQSQNCEIIPVQPYDDLKLGQFIKDSELLHLILKALKWDESNYEMEKLKNTSFRNLLANTNLLKDRDLTQLIQSYVGQDTFRNISHCMRLNDVEIHTSTGVEKNNVHLSYSEENVTKLEVRLDPYDFIHTNIYEDDDKVNKDHEDDKESIRPIPEQFLIEKFPYACTVCTLKFSSNVQLQEHIILHFAKVPKESPATLKANKFKTRIIEKMTEEKKLLKLLKNKFECAICKKRLSTKGNLKVHILTHKPKRKYSCDKCGKVFKSPKYLVRHKENHF